MDLTDITITVKYDKEVLQLMADLLTELNGIAELVPEWNQIELKQHCEKISLTLGKMLDYKPEESK